MKIEIRLLDDLGNDLIPPVSSENPAQPLEWKAPAENPVVIPRGKVTAGRYKLYGFVYVPRVTLDLREQ